jgi:3-oxoacyl-[acyl-carrier-protein] synthase II
MACEILDYRYITNWDLDTILKDSDFASQLQSNFGLIVSTQSGLDPSAQTQAWRDFFDQRRRGRPSVLRNSTADSVTSYVANTLGLADRVVSTHAECAGASYALYLASLVSQDTGRPVVVFAADNFVRDYDQWHFNSFGALDNQTGIPFDSTSKGFRMGIGACLYLVKHHSVASPIAARATIQNFHFYTNPDLVANPGSAESIINNIGSIDYARVDFWNAHATGTLVGDTVEYDFFRKTVQHDCPIVSYKGYVGHCISASAGVELAMALDDCAAQQLRPNVMRGTPIVSDDRIITQSASFGPGRMLKTSLGFGGKTCAMEIDLY